MQIAWKERSINGPNSMTERISCSASISTQLITPSSPFSITRGTWVHPGLSMSSFKRKGGWEEL